MILKKSLAETLHPQKIAVIIGCVRHGILLKHRYYNYYNTLASTSKPPAKLFDVLFYPLEFFFADFTPGVSLFGNIQRIAASRFTCPDQLGERPDDENNKSTQENYYRNPVEKPCHDSTPIPHNSLLGKSHTYHNSRENI